MKKTKFLKWITDVIFYFYCAAMIIVPIAVIIFLVIINNEGIVLGDKKITHIGFKTFLWGIFKYLISLGFLYCLFLFRKIIVLFMELEVFHKDVIKLLNQIEKHLIVLGIASFPFSYIPITYTYLSSTVTDYTITNTDILHYRIDIISTAWVMLIGIGLFCQVLSEIFKISKGLKQENDLTI